MNILDVIGYFRLEISGKAANIDNTMRSGENML